MYTREDIVKAARSLLGTRFRHQGRSPETGVDCVGFLVAIARIIDYPFEIYDLREYRRTPQPSVLIPLLGKNMLEIPLEDVGVGDVYLMTAGGRKPRHTAIKATDVTDYERGKVPTLIHALNKPGVNRVVEHPVSQWEQGFVKGYRLKGLAGVPSARECETV